MENGTHLIVVNLIQDNRNLKQTLGVIHNALSSICSDVSGPVFNSKDARDFALFVRSDIGANHLLGALERGCAATNNNPAITSGDKVLVVEIGADSAALGYSKIWKFLFSHHQKAGF